MGLTNIYYILGGFLKTPQVCCLKKQAKGVYYLYNILVTSFKGNTISSFNSSE